MSKIITWRAGKAVIEALRERGSATAREISDATDYDKEHVRQVANRLADEGYLQCDRGAGRYGADLYSLGIPEDATVETKREQHRSLIGLTDLVPSKYIARTLHVRWERGHHY